MIGMDTEWAAEEQRRRPTQVQFKHGASYHPARKTAGWTGRQHHLGRNTEVCDTELCAVRRTLQIFDESGARPVSLT